MLRTLFLLLCLAPPAALAATPVFDVHVHLRDGETSLREYRDKVHAAVQACPALALTLEG